MWLSVILLLSVHSSGILAVSPAIPENDIQLIKNIRSCRNCANKHQESATYHYLNTSLLTLAQRMIEDATCRCDEACRFYSDCCLDSPAFHLEEQFQRREDFQCTPVDHVGSYMRTNCPERLIGTYVNKACKEPSLEDPILSLPATSLNTFITYKNSYCAACYNDTKLRIWNVKLQGVELKQPLPYENLTFAGDHNKWTLNINNQSYVFKLVPSLPQDMKNSIRMCNPNLVNNCDKNWADLKVEKLCKSYSYEVYEGGTGYRNPHCAICNYKEWVGLKCINFNEPKKHTPLHSTVLDWYQHVRQNRNSSRNSSVIFDFFTKKWRVIESELNKLMSTNKTDESVTTETLCLIFHQEEVVFTENGVFVENHNKTYSFNETFMNQEGVVVICSDHRVRHVRVDKFGLTGKLITLVGFSVSSIFLILHILFFYFCNDDDKRLPKRNVTSLSFSLLFSYSTLVVGNNFDGDYCYAASVLTCYAYQTSFTWMLVISHDVWRAVQAGVHFRKAFEGKQLLRFSMYSLVGWTMPGVVSGLAVLADLLPFFPEDLKPRFGKTSCWFGSRNGLVLFFIVPFAFTITLDIIFFSLSGFTVYNSQKNSPETFKSNIRKKYILFTRLAFISGITWSTGILASLFNNIIIWHLFNALNSFQGLFIFIGFSPGYAKLKSAFNHILKCKKETSLG